LISQDNGNNRIYYQVDGLGSTRQLTDINGAVVVEYDYDAYGNLISKVGNADNNYLFAGEQFDEPTDEYYLRARYYDPATGRFVSSDPFMGYNNRPVTLHDYLYGNVNPVIFTDPSGNLSLLDKIIILSLAGLICYVGCKSAIRRVYFGWLTPAIVSISPFAAISEYLRQATNPNP
jgi:RHS repeat-associated protein